MAKVRKKEDGILPGQVTSVLTQEFVVATNTEGFDQTRVKQAFTARKLPSSEEILKLFQHLRQVAGPKNSSVKDSDLFQIILSILKFYWEMAAFPTLTDTNIRLKLKKLLENYRMQQRDKNKTSEAAKVKRTKFEGEIKKLFNIACPDIEKKLSTDRIRKNLNVVEEDLKFYQDQNTERKMTLGALDTSYLARTQAQDMRKRKAETISSVSLPDLVSLVELGEEEDHDIKARLAARILAMKNNKKKAQKLGKPKFPKIGRTTELYDLVTEDSWEFFSIIKVDDNWLEQPVGSWEDSEDYRTARNFVHNVKTTNDLAERAIKTATDYSQILTKDEETRRRIIQGVEDHRRTYPDFRKSILNK